MKRRLMMLLIALTALLAACSGDAAEDGVASLDVDDTVVSTGETPAGSTTEEVDAEVDQEQAMLDFAACMRENGIEMSDPSVDADGNVKFGSLRSLVAGDVDQEAMQAAREACSGDLEGVGLTFRENRDRTVEQDAFLTFAICMRENGFDMPDPDFSNTGPGGDGKGPFGEIDLEDPDFIVAMEPCRQFLAGTGPSGQGPPGLGG